MSIASEAGEVLNIEKKKIRDNLQYETVQKEKFEELGEVLWSLACYARRIGFDLADIAKFSLDKCEKKRLKLQAAVT